ncbi:putative Ulp1 protease family catalytic domain, papain-like cysteine peptidase superfamily [Helianthus annuus]|nr:putative Ulp1 protease family catalytic domain, papain-like cysteine peptidase superfamily [Helianthus annuus]
MILFRTYVFLTESGIGLMYFQLKDFYPSVWMGDAVINCFATVLNYEEVNSRKRTKGKNKEVYKKFGETRRLFCHTVCFNDVLTNTKYDDKGQLEKFSSALLMVLNKDASLLKLTGYTVIVFPILENHHFYLVSFDMEKLAISVIDNMHVSESFIKFSDNTDFLKKTTPFKVVNVFIKYLRSVRHPKCLEFEPVIPKRLEIEWETVGNSVDCGVFAMSHMETWFGETDLKWDSGFPLAHTQKKSSLTTLRKRYACKIVCSDANKRRDEVMGAAVAWNLAEGFEVEKGLDVSDN